MGNPVLASMIITSLAPILPGLMFLLFVEPVEDMKRYRFSFIRESDMLEGVNNAISVGVISYSFFVATVPLMNWFFGITVETTVSAAVESAGIWVQATILALLTMLNITLAYLGLQKG